MPVLNWRFFFKFWIILPCHKTQLHLNFRLIHFLFWIKGHYGSLNFENFDSVENLSKSFTSMGYFCPYKFWAEKNKEELFFITLNSDAKCHKNSGFVVSKITCEIEWTFTDKLFLSKAYISARKFQRNYVSWRWWMIQN